MKICFIGAQGHSRQTYNEMKKHPQAQFIGIAPGSPDENIDGKFLPELKRFSSYCEMLDLLRPDIAVVSPIFAYTAGIISECAKRKINVFAEKPIASSLSELSAVEDEIKKSGIRFCAMHFLRFTPSFYHAQKAVKNGEIGEIKLLCAQKSYKFGVRPSWYSDPALYVGTIPWVGIHAIDWISFFSEKAFLSVSALKNGMPEKSALCQFSLDGGVMASANIDYLRPQSACTHGDDRIRVAGTKGVIEVFNDRYVLINDKGEQVFTPNDAPLLAYDFLCEKEEITADEIFNVTKIALYANKSAENSEILKII